MSSKAQGPETRNQEPGTFSGVTLIELVVVIVLLTVGLVVALRPIWQSKKLSVQVESYNRAYALGQDLMEEILSHKWDNYISATSAQVDCPPPDTCPAVGTYCTCTSPVTDAMGLGPETNKSRDGGGALSLPFTDIDDYDGMDSEIDGCPPLGGGGTDRVGLIADNTCTTISYYSDFRERVTVCYTSGKGYGTCSGQCFGTCYPASDGTTYSSSTFPGTGNADLKYISVRISWGGTTKDQAYIDLTTMVVNR
ncbi:MAG: hypothetical protein HYT87_07805 [Nitrospirae bacterium]|nr:hypothetical protein [Nitrospirota bacterium]